jgi:hypothetical protein
MFHRAIPDLIKSGRGSLMVKLDLEQAFRHILVQQMDWPLLSFSWQGKLYHDVVLVFGLRSAPYIFNLFAEACHWILEHHIPAHFRHYLDDFLAIFLTSSPSSLVQDALQWMLELGHYLGLCFQDSKIEGLTTCLEFLGIELNSVLMEARLSPQKLQDLHEMTEEWSRRTHCTLRELEGLTSYLQFCSQVIPFSQSFIHALYDFQSVFSSTSAKCRIPPSAQKDLEWWKTVAIAWNGIHFIQPKRDEVHIYTDASGTKGIGGIFGDLWFSQRTPR